ncbi:MAG: LysE family transporter, partial [Candidatus Babeliales bacterium]
DIVYATIAIVGLSFISSFLQYHSILFRVISGLFLCILGLVIFFARPPRPRATWTRSMVEAYFSTFFLTLSNPLLILSFAALFAALHVDYLHSSYLELCALIFGVFVGSSLWWLILGGFTSLFRISILPKTIERINKISGIAILLFGLGTVISIIIK